jgi:hypothetical protein
MVDGTYGLITVLIFLLFEVHQGAYVLLVEGEMFVKDLDYFIIISIGFVVFNEEIGLLGG